MKICIICKRDGLRIYKRLKRFCVYHTSLHEFDPNTFQTCYNAIAIRKLGGLWLGEMDLNDENKNKYGFHMKCYRELVSMKRKHVRAWRDATNTRISDVYIHPNIDISLETEWRKPPIVSQTSVTQLVKSNVWNKTKLTRQERREHKRHQAKTLKEFVGPVKNGSYDLNSTSAVRTVAYETKVLLTKDKPLHKSLKTNAVSVTEKLKACETQTIEKPETKTETDSTQAIAKNRVGHSRRFKHLLAMNIPEEDAKILAVHPWRYLNKSGLLRRFRPWIPRALVAAETFNSQFDNAPESLDLPNIHDIRRNGGYFRFGIRNTRLMLKEEIEKVHCALIFEISKANKPSRPRFIRFTYKPGWLLATCGDNYTRHWLMIRVLDIDPWPEAELSIIPEDDLPETVIAYTYISCFETRPVVELLKVFKEQNKGLNTEYWQILHERKIKRGRVIGFGIDEDSVKALKKVKCRIPFGSKTIDFNIKHYYNKAYLNNCTMNKNPRPDM